MCTVTQTRLFQIKIESTLKVEEKQKENVGGGDTSTPERNFFCLKD